MKSRTSRSLAPPLSCSRTWLRRSTASGALESASVWFWHTRQRSSLDNAFTRFSRFGSSAPSTAGQYTVKIKNRSLSTPAQLLHQRQHFLLHHLARQRADVLEADHAAPVDDIGLGHPVHAVVDADAPGDVGDGQVERIAVAFEPGQRVVAGVLVVEADHRRA